MVALSHDASVLPGGRIDPACGGEVESGAGLDVRRVFDRHPCVIHLHNIFRVPKESRDTAHRHRERPLFAGGQLAVADRYAKRERWIIPLAVVLHHAPCRLIELYAKGRASGSGDLQRVASCVAQMRNAIFLRQLHRLVAKDDLPHQGVAGVLFAGERP